MNRYVNERQKIQNNLKGIRDNEIRRKARLMILVMESKSVRFGCDNIGLVRQTFYDWRKILIESNFNLNSLKSKSTRPKKSPNQTSEEDEDLIMEMYGRHGNSDRLLAFDFQEETGRKIGHSTVCLIIKRNNLSKKYRTNKPNTFNKRYSVGKPKERVQADTMWTGLEDNNGHRIYMVGFIDDCTRFTFGKLWDGKGGFEASETLKELIRKYGKPDLIQTDNGTEFTYRYVSELNCTRIKKSKKAHFEHLLEKLKINHHLIKPRTPQHNGKIERFNQTVLREFASRQPMGLPLEEYRSRFNTYLIRYNNKRGHSSLKYLTPRKAIESHSMQAA